MEAASPTDSVHPAAPPPPAGVFDELSKVVAFAREALAHLLDLVTLEARRAGVALVWMMAGGLVAAICIVTAWAGLMAALAMYAVSLGLVPIAAAILVAAINLGAGAGLIYCCIGVSRRLLFTATRRQLAGTAIRERTAP